MSGGVTGWMRADPAFAAEVAQARTKGDYRRRLMFDDAKAAAFLGRVRAGERIGAVLRDRAMPSPATYRYWLATNAAFAEAMHAVREGRKAERAAWARGRCRAYDPAIGEKIYVRLWKGGATLREILKSEREFPSLSVLARWRRENPAFEAMLQVAISGWRKQRGRGRLLLNDALQEEILVAIANGHSLRSLSALPGMPSQRTLYNWCRTRPEFARYVGYACEDREEFYLEEAAKILGAAVPGGWGAAKKAVAGLNAQRVRLRKRPGWKRAARDEAR